MVCSCLAIVACILCTAVLQLQNITLGGTLSAEWAAQLPTELVTLRLDGSSLTGSLPSDFDLPKVVQFAAPGNQLSG